MTGIRIQIGEDRNQNFIAKYGEYSFCDNVRDRIEKIKYEFESLRQECVNKAQNQLKIMYFSGALAGLLLVMGLLISPAILLLLIIPAIPGIISYWERKYANITYQNNVIPKILTVLNESADKSLIFSFEGGGISKGEYIANPLVPKTDYFEPSMYIKGTSDKGIPFEACSLITYYEKKSNIERESSGRILSFEGMLIKIKFSEEKFHEQVAITSSLMKVTAGSFWESLIGTGISSYFERVKMDHPEFEDNFNVFGTDIVQTKYLLTYSFMQNLFELLKGLKCYVNIWNGCIYIAIEGYKPKVTLPTIKTPYSLYNTTKDILAYKNAVEYFIEKLEVDNNLITSNNAHNGISSSTYS